MTDDDIAATNQGAITGLTPIPTQNPPSDLFFNPISSLSLADVQTKLFIKSATDKTRVTMSFTLEA